MGIFSWLTSSPVADLAKPIDAVGNLYTTDKAKIEATKDLIHEENQTQIAQAEVNKVYASSSYFFNSAWVPLLGYTCGFLILLYYAPQIIICTWVWGKTALATGVVKQFPMQASDLLYLIGLLYGVGTHSLVKRN